MRLAIKGILLIFVGYISYVLAYGFYQIAQHKKQNHTMEKMRNCAEKVSIYRRTYGKLPDSQSISELLRILQLPEDLALDEWRKPLFFETWSDSQGSHFRLASPGRDGVMQTGRIYHLNITDDWDYDADIVFQD